MQELVKKKKQLCVQLEAEESGRGRTVGEVLAPGGTGNNPSLPPVDHTLK